MSDKLFIVTRADLPPGARAAQSVHAALAFAFDHPEVAGEWHEGSNNVVLLEAKDERALVELWRRAWDAGVPYSVFTEPDLGDATTGVAIGPAGHKLVSSLPLTLRAARQTRESPEQTRGLSSAAG
jgi:peptidyl-tRNA hydrolase